MNIQGHSRSVAYISFESQYATFYTVSQKTVKIVFGITLLNFHQLW